MKETVFSAFPSASVKEIKCGDFVVTVFCGSKEQMLATTEAYASEYPPEYWETSCQDNAQLVKEATWGENMFDLYQLVGVRRRRPSFTSLPSP